MNDEARITPPTPPLATSFSVTLPDWLTTGLSTLPATLVSDEQRMDLILELARRNAQENTGGPFAAGVFETASGRLVSVGVNRVMATCCSSAHAEVVALSLAQARLAVYDLGGPEQPVHELVVNWRPCAMCFGALLWSGVRRLVIPGSGPELEDLTGFDEGPLAATWRTDLAARGIVVKEGPRHPQAIALFRWFAASGKTVYNSRQG